MVYQDFVCLVRMQKLKNKLNYCSHFNCIQRDVGLGRMSLEFKHHI